MILGNQMHLDTRWMVIRSAGRVIVINLAPDNSDNPPFLSISGNYFLTCSCNSPCEEIGSSQVG